MNQRRKKILAIILIALVFLLGAAAIVVSILLQKAAVPTAPPSRPRAAEEFGGGACNVSFTVAEEPRPDLCQSLTKSRASLKPGESVTLTSVSKSSATRFSYAIYNLDNLYGPGNPKPLCVTGGIAVEGCPSGTGHLILADPTTTSRTTGSKTVTYEELFVTDKQTNAVPGSVQVNGYFMVSDTSPVSLPKPDCVTSIAKAEAPSPASLTCTQKMAYRDVASNTAGTYQLTSANLVGANEKVVAGQRFIYALAYKNDGGTAGNLTLTDTLDTKLTFVDATTGCAYNSSTRVVTCTINNVGVGQSGTAGIRVRVNAGTSGDIANTASVTGGNSCNKALTIATASIACTTKQAYRNETGNEPGSYIYAQTIDSVAQNETFVYDIKLKNSGDATASAVTITDAFNGENQDKLSYVDGNSGCTYNSTNKTVTCNATNVAPGAEVAWAFRAKVASGATNGQVIKNTATVTYGEASTTCNKDLTVSGVVGCSNACTSDSQCSGGLTCVSNMCRNAACSEVENCACPTATVTATPTPAACRNGCGAGIACAGGLTCGGDGLCHNATCPTTDTANCTCPVAAVTTVAPTGTATATPTGTATATPTGTATATPTGTASPTAATLPETGIFNLPGAAVFGGGLLLTILGILFAL